MGTPEKDAWHTSDPDATKQIDVSQLRSELGTQRGAEPPRTLTSQEKVSMTMGAALVIVIVAACVIGIACGAFLTRVLVL